MVRRRLSSVIACLVLTSLAGCGGEREMAERVEMPDSMPVMRAMQDAEARDSMMDTMPGGEMYPVMMTLVQTLITHDRKAFLRYFDDIKAGVDPEAALRTHYSTDYDGLIAAWKKFLTTSSSTGRK